ncbi:hypothetical protein [Olleya sp. HaHaR_3_96]|uniref:hypothetical protein n=1 Tax=Olleya sp. HaHaR_3_96 TaxID=2745560 RepID=UPI001C4FE924|nr:hypothetical protein [Olleya sp. HaHaR_3_96]QXP61565.1 hypothetical protein H0I26_08025 [Olleya sp. HaHaR_3_96]
MTSKELSLLEGTALKTAFIAYFKPWALTSSCSELLKEMSSKIIEVTYDENLKIYFKNDDDDDDDDDVQITFGKPYKGAFQDSPFTVPKSYKTVVEMHNTIIFGEGIPYGIGFHGYNGKVPWSGFATDQLKADQERHQGFCDAGQNWIIWDHQRKNALGEPVIIIVDHGLAVEDNDDFPEQDEIAFGTGGLFIRLMSQFILDNPKYNWE